MRETMTRREVLKAAGCGVLGALTNPQEFVVPKEDALNLPWENGKYQTFPRQAVVLPKALLGQFGMCQADQLTSFSRGDENFTWPVKQLIDLGTLGPDVDTIAGIDFQGDIPTNALVIYQPDGEVIETRVVFIKRADLETVQLQPALGGDRFDVYKMSEYGGDQALDAMARKHAENTAREHQKVIYLGDLGLFQKQWGEGEKPLLNAIIRAQRPDKPELGIMAPDFVQERVW